tara:strand:- start:87 stop:281 length:195 start_codon:yes stop_codon:yes gene_type:complete
MPQISDELMVSLLRFKTSQTFNGDGNALRDLGNYCQQVYVYSIDKGCAKCIGKWMNRIIEDNNL